MGNAKQIIGGPGSRLPFESVCALCKTTDCGTTNSVACLSAQLQNNIEAVGGTFEGLEKENKVLRGRIEALAECISRLAVAGIA